MAAANYELAAPCPHRMGAGGICGEPTFCTYCGGCLYHCPTDREPHEANGLCARCRVLPHRDGSLVCQGCHDEEHSPEHAAWVAEQIRLDNAEREARGTDGTHRDTRGEHSNDLDGVA